MCSSRLVVTAPALAAAEIVTLVAIWRLAAMVLVLVAAATVTAAVIPTSVTSFFEHRR